MKGALKRFVRDERGVTSLEYAILAAIVVGAVVSIGTVLSSSANGLPNLFQQLINDVTTAVNSKS